MAWRSPTIRGSTRPPRERVLTVREREVLGRLAEGQSIEDIAGELVLSTETIRTHIRNAMNKLEANTRVHAIAIALREGFISAPSGSS